MHNTGTRARLASRLPGDLLGLGLGRAGSFRGLIFPALPLPLCVVNHRLHAISRRPEPPAPLSSPDCLSLASFMLHDIRALADVVDVAEGFDDLALGAVNYDVAGHQVNFLKSTFQSAIRPAASTFMMT